MHQLRAIQCQFWSSLKSRKAHSECIQLFSEDGETNREKRLDIYRTTMRTAHVHSLANTYSCCEKILGKQYFRQMATEFYYEHPATHQDLNLYGATFPEFLRNWTRNHAELADYQYLPDLATLELAYERSYYAKEDPPFDFQMLATLDEDDHRSIRFELGASLSTLKSNYPVHEVWMAHQGHEEVKEISAIDEPQYLCIARENFKPVIHKIDQAYWQVMAYIENGNSFGNLETFVQQENLNIPLQTIIPELISRKWICGYQVAGRTR